MQHRIAHDSKVALEKLDFLQCGRNLVVRNFQDFRTDDETSFPTS